MTPIITTLIKREVRNINGVDMLIWLPTIIKDYGTWNEERNLYAFSAEDAQIKLQELIKQHA